MHHATDDTAEAFTSGMPDNGGEYFPPCTASQHSGFLAHSETALCVVRLLLCWRYYEFSESEHHQTDIRDIGGS